MPIYGLDIGKNLIQVYTTTEVLTILQEAIDNQSLAGLDPSIAPVITAVKESNGNNNITFWLGTEAEFNALGITAKQIFARVDATGKLYLCTDDSTLDDWLAAAKAEITGDVAADITAAQTTADNAIAENAITNSRQSFSDIVTEVLLNGSVVSSNDYTINATISLPTTAAKNPKYGISVFTIFPFSFNDERTIPAGSKLQFKINSSYKVQGQGIVLGATPTEECKNAGVFLANLFTASIYVYVESATNIIMLSGCDLCSYVA